MLILRCDSLVAMAVKNLPAVQETWVLSLSQEDPLEEEMATYSGFLPGKYHAQRSLKDYSPWGHKESDMTEWLNNKQQISLLSGLPRWLS